MKEYLKNILIPSLILVLCSGAVSYINAQNQIKDYFVYYGGFDENDILKVQYYDMIILDVRSITPEQVVDIRNGFDNVQGNDDDVIVLGYLSIGEQDGSLIPGDGTGPVYWNGSQVVNQNNGYASFYVDDKDKDGMPDVDGVWNSYYVNAGDTAWWEFNRPLAEDVLVEHGCDGLFLDLVDTGGPNSWGLSYQWTAEGMIRYIEHLREIYSGKYILANRGVFYFDPSLPAHYIYADRYRKSIDGLMIESYFAAWDWNQSIGIYNTGFPYLRDHFAPLINAQANQSDGFEVFILDYLKLNQSNYSALLDTVVKVTERDQGWLVSISTILLDSIRYDTYNHHLSDINPPAWMNTVGISKYKWKGDELEVYWDTAIDQTSPLKYHLYISENQIDFSSPADYPDLTPLSSDVSDYKFIISGLNKNKTYFASLRASDSSVPEKTDPNRKVVEILPGENKQIIIDGYFDDWSVSNQLDYSGDKIEQEGDTIVSKSCDLIDVWYSEDENNFYFSFSAGAQITAPPYYYHVFIDEDNNSATGYHSNNSLIGIDIMCENGYLWRYNGSNGEWSWQYITQVNYMLGINNNKQAEFVIQRTYFTGNPQSISFIYHIDNANASVEDDYSPNNYSETFYRSNVVSINEPGEQLPEKLKVLHHAYPNPFNSAITFAGTFNKPVTGEIEIMIFDITGSLIHKQVVAAAGSPEFRYHWNGENSEKRELPSGVYLYRINGKKENLLSHGKIVYLK